jgi:hypothetical protein
MWYGHLARHRQDACATSLTSEMETLYGLIETVSRYNSSPRIQETRFIKVIYD